MSKRIVRRGICMMVAAIALGSLAAGSAAAEELPTLPYWWSAGSFPISISFTSGKALIETSTGVTECPWGVSGTGSITGFKKGHAVLTFQQCKCTSEGQVAGTIKTSELEVTPVYYSKANKLVALYLKPPVGTTFAKFSCGGLVGQAEMRGALLVEFRPINEMRTTFEGLVLEGTKGTIFPGSYENEKGELVKITFESNIFNGGTKFEAADIKAQLTMNVGGSVELRA